MMQNTIAAHSTRSRSAVTRPPRRRRHRHSTRSLGRLETALILLVAVLFATTLVWQLLGTDTVAIERTAVISVAPSDTLWEIAEAHPMEGLTTAETVDAIVAINEMDTSSLVAGQALLVPAPNSSEAAVAVR